MDEIIAKINAENKRISKNYAYTIIGVFPLGVIGLVYPPLLIAGIIFLIYRFKVNKEERQKLNIYVKQNVVNHYLGKAFQNVIYEPTKGMDVSLIEGTGLFRMGNRFYSNDLIQAMYNEVPFTHADVLIQSVEKTDDGKRVRDLFKGKVLYFDFPKNTDVYLQIRERGREKVLKPRLSWQGMEIEKLQMENEEFNRKFDVYSSSQQDAFYVLTPHVMESIIEIEKNVNGSIVLGLVEKRLYVGLNTNEDTFELEASAEFDVKKIEDDMNKLITFIDSIGDVIVKSILQKDKGNSI